MDSSPDLSLKLRRGSSDSRDSFYMDFAQGIDSDIEEVATTTSGPIISHGQMDRTHTIDDDDDMGGVPLPKDDGWVFLEYILLYIFL